MTLYLVRHAKAVGRAAWEGDERRRPLNVGGHRQALRLVVVLRELDRARLISSPLLRCRQTLEPLAAQRGWALEVDSRLTEGGDFEAALGLIQELDGGAAVLCGHGDLIPRLVAHLCREGGLRSGPIRCEKGSVWVLEGRPPSRARYLSPPARGRGDSPLFEPRPARTPAPPSAVTEAPVGADPAKERIAVLDLGSTSFHLLVADASPPGEIQRVVTERSMLRLGALIATAQRVPDAVCERAVETARSLQQLARVAGAERLLPVATAALREATNGAELADRIAQAVGEPVRVLSGEEEARLMFAAFRQRVALPEGLALGIDLGGGSLELAVGDADRVHWEQTLRLGVARLWGELVDSDPLSKRNRNAVRERVIEEVEGCREAIVGRRPACSVATGGTVAALARLLAARRRTWPRRSVGPLFVPRSELVELADQLVRASHDERLGMRGMARPRIDLLPTGALVLATLCRVLDLDGFTVSDWGLREGVILEALGLAAG